MSPLIAKNNPKKLLGIRVKMCCSSRWLLQRYADSDGRLKLRRWLILWKSGWRREGVTLSWPQSSPVLSPPSPAEGLNPQSSIFSVFQSFSVSVLFSPSQSFSVLIHIFWLLKLITDVFGNVFDNTSHTTYTVNLHLVIIPFLKDKYSHLSLK